MNNILTIIAIIAIIAFIMFIVWNVFEIVMAHKFYKKIEKEHQDLIDKLIDETVDDLLGNTKDTMEFINDEVEILDEEDEFIDIEEITIRDNTIGFPNGEWTSRNMDKAFSIKINDLIKNQKKIINKLKEEGK